MDLCAGLEVKATTSDLFDFMLAIGIEQSFDMVCRSPFGYVPGSRCRWFRSRRSRLWILKRCCFVGCRLSHFEWLKTRDWRDLSTQ